MPDQICFSRHRIPGSSLHPSKSFFRYHRHGCDLHQGCIGGQFFPGCASETRNTFPSSSRQISEVRRSSVARYRYFSNATLFIGLHFKLIGKETTLCPDQPPGIAGSLGKFLRQDIRSLSFRAPCDKIYQQFLFEILCQLLRVPPDSGGIVSAGPLAVYDLIKLLLVNMSKRKARPTRF